MTRIINIVMKMFIVKLKKSIVYLSVSKEHKYQRSCSSCEVYMFLTIISVSLNMYVPF